MGNLGDILTAVLIIYFIANLILSCLMSDVARQKGHGGAFLLCFFFGPAAYLYVVALPDLELRKQNDRLIESLEDIKKINAYNAYRSESSIKCEVDDDTDDVLPSI